VYVPQAWRLTSADRDAILARAATVDLAPGPGGSRITPCGTVTVAGVTGRGAFVVLYPSSQLVRHQDPPIAGVRYHVPLVLNDGCWVFHGGTWQQLEVDQGYVMDPTVEHGAVNWGTNPRMHLMVDVEG
jgi:hypothetical protein